MRQVTGVVNMCDEYYGPVAEYEKRHMKQIYLPTGIRTYDADLPSYRYPNLVHLFF